MASASVSEKRRGEMLEIVKGITIAMVISLVLVLLFALLIKFANIPTAAIVPVNQGIKAISLLVGAIFSFKTKAGGWRKGLILGIIYVALAYVVFSLLDGTFKFDISLLYDAIMGALMGVVSGVIAVNLGKKE